MENSTFNPSTLNSRKIALISVVLAAVAIYAIMIGGVKAGALVIASPLVVWLIVSIFKDARVGIYTLFIINYFAMGISRYIPGPLGLAVDGFLTLIYLSLIFKSVRQKGVFAPANRDLTYLAILWYLYAIFQLFNPEAASRTAWFFAMRGFSLYFAMTIPLVFILLNRRRDLNLILTLWSIFTLLAVLKGLVQEAGFIDSAEQKWLSEIGAKTHIVNGRLRVFSFFTDAGQFGGTMGFSGVVFGLSAIGMQNRKQKYYYLFVSLMAFIGMFLSGTRGAIAVPAAGFLMFAMVAGNRKIIISTLTIVALTFIFFKYTNVGNSNYQINRMRTAFNGNDASLQARLMNQAKLSDYLASRPFGGGIGSAGNWGQRFAPNSFLANVPTDSWYVSIWAEQGIVGLTLHLFIIFYVLIKGSFLVRKVRDPELAHKLKGLLCGVAGVAVASYGNGVMGQMPTGIIIYIAMGFIFMSKQLDDEKKLV